MLRIGSSSTTAQKKERSQDTNAQQNTSNQNAQQSKQKEQVLHLSRQSSSNTTALDYFQNQGRGKRTRLEYKYKKQIDLIQDNTHQFKMMNLTNLDVFRHMIERYISAFLNTNGGTLYFGISDNGIINGIKLSRKNIDDLKLKVDSIMQHIEPPLINNEVKVKAVPCYNNRGNQVINLFVVEIHISKGEKGKIYCTSQNQVFIRRNASCFKLTDARSIIEFVESKKKQKD